MGMYRKAMSTHLAAGDDSHHGRCDDGKELCPSGRKPCGPEMSLGLSDHLGGLIDRSWCNYLFTAVIRSQSSPRCHIGYKVDAITTNLQCATRLIAA